MKKKYKIWTCKYVQRTSVENAVPHILYVPSLINDNKECGHVAETSSHSCLSDQTSMDPWRIHTCNRAVHLWSDYPACILMSGLNSAKYYQEKGIYWNVPLRALGFIGFAQWKHLFFLHAGIRNKDLREYPMDLCAKTFYVTWHEVHSTEMRCLWRTSPTLDLEWAAGSGSWCPVYSLQLMLFQNRTLM